MSNVDVDQIERARRITEIVSVQNRLAGDGTDDAEERDMLAYCERHGIAYLPWAPLGGGSLRAGAFAEVARAHGATVNQVALAYLLRRSPVVTPIPGTSSIAHLEENVAAASLTLSDDDVAALARRVGGARPEPSSSVAPSPFRRRTSRPGARAR